jgi:predicted nucleic acid-binding protein
MIFVDTSAFLAILLTSDINHQRAMTCWRALLEEGQALLTNNYVLVESIAIIQKRLGLSIVRDFYERRLPGHSLNFLFNVPKVAKNGPNLC